MYLVFRKKMCKIKPHRNTICKMHHVCNMWDENDKKSENVKCDVPQH